MVFWRRRRPKKRTVEDALHDLRRLGVDRVMLGCGMFGLVLPIGTVVDECGPGVGWFQPPRSAGRFYFSVSSYDIEFYGLRDTRPALAAIDEGEELGPAWAERDGANDYDDIIGVAADDGPYAQFGGFMMRLFLHEGRYLRAIRIACTEPDDLEQAHALLTSVFVSQMSTPLDLDQPARGAAQILVRGHFRMTLPDGWTLRSTGRDENGEDEAGEDVEGPVVEGANQKLWALLEDEDCDEDSDWSYGRSPDNKLLIEVRVAEGWPHESLPKEGASDAYIPNTLAKHVGSVLKMMEDQGRPGSIVELEDDYCLLATDGGRQDDGRYGRLFTMESFSSDHRVYAHFWLTSLGTEVDAEAWNQVAAPIERSVRGALVFHRQHFAVGT